MGTICAPLNDALPEMRMGTGRWQGGVRSMWHCLRQDRQDITACFRWLFTPTDSRITYGGLYRRLAVHDGGERQSVLLRWPPVGMDWTGLVGLVIYHHAARYELHGRIISASDQPAVA